jgi:hypothetical protein
MSEHPTSEQPTQPGVSAARPATVGGDEQYGGSYAIAVDRDVVPRRPQWVPLLPGPTFVVLLILGLVAGIAGPVLLWLNVAHKGSPLYARVGFLLVLVGLGLILIALPLLLGEALRMGRSSSGEAGVEPVRGMTGVRMFALIAVAVLIAGAFLMHPADSSATTGGGGSSHGRGGGQGGGSGQAG